MTRKQLTAVIAAAAGAALLTTSAAAGDGGGNPHGTPPGQVGKATPPGQAGKAAPGQRGRSQSAKPANAVKPKPKAPRGKGATRGAKRNSPSSRAVSASQSSVGKTTICHRTGSQTNPWVEITVSDNALDAHRRHGDLIPGGNCPSGSRAQSGGGQEKVTICHRTRSAKNPFVTITIARAGWENGHSKHEGDFILQPGEQCPQAAGAQGGAVANAQGAGPCPPSTTSGGEAGVWHKTGSAKNPYVFITPSPRSAHYDRTKHPDDIIVSGSQPSGATAAASCGVASQPTGGVAGVRAALGKPAARPAASRGRGGVLGVTSRLGSRPLRGTLPYTGFPLWAVGLAGLMLAGTGYWLRRANVGARR